MNKPVADRTYHSNVLHRYRPRTRCPSYWFQMVYVDDAVTCSAIPGEIHATDITRDPVAGYGCLPQLRALLARNSEFLADLSLNELRLGCHVWIDALPPASDPCRNISRRPSYGDRAG